MENERFQLQNVAKTVEMAASSSKMLQIARKTDRKRIQKKNKAEKQTNNWTQSQLLMWRFPFRHGTPNHPMKNHDSALKQPWWRLGIHHDLRTSQLVTWWSTGKPLDCRDEGGDLVNVQSHGDRFGHLQFCWRNSEAALNWVHPLLVKHGQLGNLLFFTFS